VFYFDMELIFIATFTNQLQYIHNIDILIVVLYTNYVRSKPMDQ